MGSKPTNLIRNENTQSTETTCICHLQALGTLNTIRHRGNLGMLKLICYRRLWERSVLFAMDRQREFSTLLDVNRIWEHFSLFDADRIWAVSIQFDIDICILHWKITDLCSIFACSEGGATSKPVSVLVGLPMICTGSAGASLTETHNTPQQ